MTPPAQPQMGYLAMCTRQPMWDLVRGVLTRNSPFLLKIWQIVHADISGSGINLVLLLVQLLKGKYHNAYQVLSEE